MTEDDAKGLVASFVGGAAISRLDQFASLVIDENHRQNLVGRSTVETIWQRHILDSIQLLRFAESSWSTWLDVGTGGGFPGLAIACAVDLPMILVEPRALRASFLRRAADALTLSHVRVLPTKVEHVTEQVDVISARAVTAPALLMRRAVRCATAETTWLLPAGQEDRAGVEAIRRAHPGMRFHVERSVTNEAATILVGIGRP